MNRVLYNVTLALLVVMLIGAAALVVSMPWTMQKILVWTQDIFTTLKRYTDFILVFAMVNGALACWILCELIFMIRTTRTNPFVQRNAVALGRMGVAAFIMTGTFVLKCVVGYSTTMTLACAAVLLLAGMCCQVLKAVFRKAIHYKQENDLVI